MIRGSDCAYSIQAESLATVLVAEVALVIGHWKHTQAVIGIGISKTARTVLQRETL